MKVKSVIDFLVRLGTFNQVRQFIDLIDVDEIQDSSSVVLLNFVAIKGLSMGKIFVSVSKDNSVNFLNSCQEIRLSTLRKPENSSIVIFDMFYSFFFEFNVVRISNLNDSSFLCKFSNLSQSSFNNIIAFLCSQNNNFCILLLIS